MGLPPLKGTLKTLRPPMAPPPTGRSIQGVADERQARVRDWRVAAAECTAGAVEIGKHRSGSAAAHGSAEDRAVVQLGTVQSSDRLAWPSQYRVLPLNVKAASGPWPLVPLNEASTVGVPPPAGTLKTSPSP